LEVAAAGLDAAAADVATEGGAGDAATLDGAGVALEPQAAVRNAANAVAARRLTGLSAAILVLATLSMIVLPKIEWAKLNKGHRIPLAL
jgi:hypothetical protein